MDCYGALILHKKRAPSTIDSTTLHGIPWERRHASPLVGILVFRQRCELARFQKSYACFLIVPVARSNTVQEASVHLVASSPSYYYLKASELHFLVGLGLQVS